MYFGHGSSFFFFSSSEDWFKIDPIEVSMNDEEDSLLDASSFTNKVTACHIETLMTVI